MHGINIQLNGFRHTKTIELQLHLSGIQYSNAFEIVFVSVWKRLSMGKLCFYCHWLVVVLCYIVLLWWVQLELHLMHFIFPLTRIMTPRSNSCSTDSIPARRWHLRQIPNPLSSKTPTMRSLSRTLNHSALDLHKATSDLCNIMFIRYAATFSR